MSDFTVRGFGVRVVDTYCVVIEKKSGVVGWVEDGQRHTLPLPGGFDTMQAIPTSRVAIAFKQYQDANPESGLRELLTGKAEQSKGE